MLKLLALCRADAPAGPMTMANVHPGIAAHTEVKLYKGLKSFNIKDNVLWAKHMFLFSLIVLMSFSVMLSVGSILP